MPDAANGGEPLRDPRATIERVGTSDFVVVRTHRSIHDPIVAFRVELGCGNRLARDYVALIDPAPVARSIPEAGTVGIAATIEATRSGSAAADKAASASGEVATLAQQRERQPRPPQNAAAPTAATAGPATRVSVPVRPDVRQAAPLPMAARAAVPGPTAQTAAGIPASRATSDPLPQATRVVLRVETELPDTAASARLSEADRDILRRTSALVMHGDDQVAAVLALQDRLRQLETRVGELQDAIGRQSAGSAPVPVPAPREESSALQRSDTLATGEESSPAAAPAARDLRTLAVGSVLALAALLAGSVYWRARRRQSRAAATSATDVEPVDIASSEAGSAATTVIDATLNDLRQSTPLDLTIAQGATHATAIDSPASGNEGQAPLDLSIATGAFATVRTVPDSTPAFDATVWRGATASTDLAPIEFTLDGSTPAPASAIPATAYEPIDIRDPATDERDGHTASGPIPSPREVQERYFVERYGADALGAAPLGDPEALVKQARMHYQDDGDLFKSIDLLELAIAFDPAAERPWLALFAILSGERMHPALENLARRYREQCPDHRHWPSIRRLGREIDPGNPLYGVQDVTGIAGPPAEGLIEEWLGVPLDFTSHLMLVELREALVQSAATDSAAVDAAA